MKKIIVIPDAHVPFHDHRACNVMLQAGQGFMHGCKDGTLVTLGDQLDCYSISSHSKDPRRVRHLEEEIEAGQSWLDSLELIGCQTRHFIAGNHEWRLERYLQEHAPALFTTCKIETLLRLKERKWSYTPYKHGIKLGKVYYTHDLGQAGQFAAARARVRYGGNIVIGHTHYASASYMGNIKGETHVGISAGWLGSAKAIDYTTAVNASEWVHSFLTGYIEDSGVTHFQLVPVVNGRCVVEGRLYK